MKKLLLASLLLTTLAIAVVRVDFALNPEHRTAVFKGLCEAGLPNLSRPPEVPARHLGCAVLGPKQTVQGFVSTGFEASHLIMGDQVVTDQYGFLNESAWLSGTDGLEQRGEAALDGVLSVRRPGLCGGRLAKVTLEGWMTVSPGGFGHLNLAEREFFAYRVISATAPSEEELEPFLYGGAPDWPPDNVAFCREQESPDYEGL